MRPEDTVELKVVLQAGDDSHSSTHVMRSSKGTPNYVGEALYTVAIFTIEAAAQASFNDLVVHPAVRRFVKNRAYARDRGYWLRCDPFGGSMKFGRLDWEKHRYTIQIVVRCNMLKPSFQGFFWKLRRFAERLGAPLRRNKVEIPTPEHYIRLLD